MGHGWTRMHTDKTLLSYPCLSVSIRGPNIFMPFCFWVYSEGSRGSGYRKVLRFGEREFGERGAFGDGEDAHPDLRGAQHEGAGRGAGGGRRGAGSGLRVPNVST